MLLICSLLYLPEALCQEKRPDFPLGCRKPALLEGGLAAAAPGKRPGHLLIEAAQIPIGLGQAVADARFRPAEYRRNAPGKLRRSVRQIP